MNCFLSFIINYFVVSIGLNESFEVFMQKWSLEKNGNIYLKFQDKGLEITDNVIIKNASIYSPLEPGDTSITIKNQIIELLSYNLNIHYVMIYLIIMCIFILSIKIIIDLDLSFDYIKNWPFGTFIYKFISKLLKMWSKTNIYWLYYILFSLLIMMIGSTYGLYGSLVLIDHI